MPIPPRLRPPPVRESDVEALSPLCDAIEDGVNRGEDVTELLAEWHRHATRTFRPVEFTKYYGAVSKEEFIAGALLPVPQFVSDLTYEELKSVLTAVTGTEIDDSTEQTYFVEWLEANLPACNISDLIYWPDQWFGNEALFRDERGHFRPGTDLSDDQILRYAMFKSARSVPGAPADVPLPFPMPGD